MRKLKSGIKKAILTLTLGLVCFTGVKAYQVYNNIDQSYKALERGNKSEKRVAEVKLTEDPVSVLLLGVEDYATGGQNGRADSIMVATVQPKTKDVKIVSIPRDTYVKVKGHGNTKINHSYAYGGKDLTIQTVEDFLEIPIDYYVQVDFKGFKKLVDEVDGVNVNVPFDFTETSDVKKRKIEFEKGPATLNGEQALAYARMRKQDPNGDFGRADRQKELAVALAEKMAEPKRFMQVGDITNHIGEYVQTNIHVSDALSLVKTYSGFKGNQVEVLKIDGEGTKIDGVYYFEADEEKLNGVKNTLKDHLDGVEAELKKKENPEK